MIPRLVNLGEMYEGGKVVARDLFRAKEVFKQAAAVGDTEAEMKLPELQGRRAV